MNSRFAALIVVMAAVGGLVCGILVEHYVGTGHVIDWAGLRHLSMAYRTRDLGGRAAIPISDIRKGRIMVVLALGQSNAANSGESLGSAHAGVFEFYRGQIYNARDPLLGAEGSGGSIWLRLGALVKRSGNFDTVILVPYAIGTTEIRRWAPGGSLHTHLLKLVDQVHALGLEFTHLLWQQGEADAIAGNAGIEYQEAFLAMANALRQHGVMAPIYIAVASRCGKVRPVDDIRQAQIALVDRSQGRFPGPDTDALSFGDRYDGCHFSTEGLDRAAELWLQSIVSNPPAPN